MVQRWPGGGSSSIAAFFREVPLGLDDTLDGSSKKRHWLDPLHLLDFNNIYIPEFKQVNGSAQLCQDLSTPQPPCREADWVWHKENQHDQLCGGLASGKTMESFFVGKVSEAQHLQLLPFEWRRPCSKGIPCIHLASLCWLLDVRRVQWCFV